MFFARAVFSALPLLGPWLPQTAVPIFKLRPSGSKNNRTVTQTTICPIYRECCVLSSPPSPCAAFPRKPAAQATRTSSASTCAPCCTEREWAPPLPWAAGTYARSTDTSSRAPARLKPRCVTPFLFFEIRSARCSSGPSGALYFCVLTMYDGSRRRIPPSPRGWRRWTTTK